MAGLQHCLLYFIHTKAPNLLIANIYGCMLLQPVPKFLAVNFSGTLDTTLPDIWVCQQVTVEDRWIFATCSRSNETPISLVGDSMTSTAQKFCRLDTELFRIRSLTHPKSLRFRSLFGLSVVLSLSRMFPFTLNQMYVQPVPSPNEQVYIPGSSLYHSIMLSP